MIMVAVWMLWLSTDGSENMSTREAETPTASPTQSSYIALVIQTVVVTTTAYPTSTATATPLPNCEISLFQGTVCQWPTPTVILPIPTCGARESGLVCVRRGPVQATIPLPTRTPTPALGVVVKESQHHAYET